MVEEKNKGKTFRILLVVAFIILIGALLIKNNIDISKGEYCELNPNGEECVCLNYEKIIHINKSYFTEKCIEYNISFDGDPKELEVLINTERLEQLKRTDNFEPRNIDWNFHDTQLCIKFGLEYKDLIILNQTLKHEKDVGVIYEETSNCLNATI